MQPPTTTLVAAIDGTPLAVHVWLPQPAEPAAVPAAAVIEVPAAHSAGFAGWHGGHRPLVEAGFAVVVVDRRGTGLSGGAEAGSHTPDQVADLRQVIAWVTGQPWCSGAVAVIGTGDAGTTALDMAMQGEPAVKAVVAAHPTDDRYSDGGHRHGGVLRAAALLGEPLAELAAAVQPPDPAAWAAVHGPGVSWLDEWRRRLGEHEPAVLDTFLFPDPGPVWQLGSVRLGPDGLGYRRIGCPSLLIAGWGAASRNVVFRALDLMPYWRMIAGPWDHGDPATALPGPNVDATREIVRFLDQHLRGGPRATERRGRLFVLQPGGTAGEASGHWVEVDAWPPVQLQEEPRRTRAAEPGAEEIDAVEVGGDTGVTGLDGFGEGPAWLRPVDQREDDARSITYDWLHRVSRRPGTAKGPLMVFGAADLTMQVRTSATDGQLAVKLCDVAPDGTSTLITRSMLDLRRLGCFPADPFGTLGTEPRPVPAGEWIDVRVQFDGTTWTLVPGHRLRVSIAGSDWPHCWPPARRATLEVRRPSVRLLLHSAATMPAARDQFAPSPATAAPLLPTDADGWTVEHDVLARETRVHLAHEREVTRHDSTALAIRQHGSLGVSTVDPAHAWASGRTVCRSTRTIDGRRQECVTVAELDVRSDRDQFHVRLVVTAHCDGELIGGSEWVEDFPRS